MKTIKNDVCHEYDIKKSRFISFLFYIDSEEDAKEKINDIKSKYKDASHHCYSYVCDNIVRFSDDGEPSGTAGMPILNVLTNNDLNHILAITVRYFGGIKLGAGGLVRAYTYSITSALDKTAIVQLLEGYEIKISFAHSNIKTVDNMLKKYTNDIKKEYHESVNYTFFVDKENLTSMIAEIGNIIKIETQKNALIR